MFRHKCAGNVAAANQKRLQEIWFMSFFCLHSKTNTGFVIIKITLQVVKQTENSWWWLFQLQRPFLIKVTAQLIYLNLMLEVKCSKHERLWGMACSGKRLCLSSFLQHLTCALNTPVPKAVSNAKWSLRSVLGYISRRWQISGFFLTGFSCKFITGRL